MITWTPTAAEEVIIQTGTGGLKVDRLELDGTLRFRVEREPDPATQRTIIDVALRCTKATSVVFAVLRSRTTSKPGEPRPNPMRDPNAEGAAVIADAPRRGPLRWCDMRKWVPEPCCGRVVFWLGEVTDEYGEELFYAKHPWSEDAAMGFACEAHLAEASAPIAFSPPAVPVGAPTLKLGVREEMAGCGCCSGSDVAYLENEAGEEIARTEDVPGPRQDVARWARAAKRKWWWADGKVDLRRVRIVDGRT